jgi:hypothetical protein
MICSRTKATEFSLLVYLKNYSAYASTACYGDCFILCYKLYIKLNFVGFELFRAAAMYNSVLCDITLCSQFKFIQLHGSILQNVDFFNVTSKARNFNIILYYIIYMYIYA